MNAVKSIVKQQLPRWAGYQLKKIILGVRSIIYRGNAFYCPICQHGYSKFFDGGFDLPVIEQMQIIGAGRRKHIICPGCASNDRDRLVFMALKSPDLQLLPAGKILHIAPEPALVGFLQKKQQSDGNTYVMGVKYHEGFYYDNSVQLIDLTSLKFNDKLNITIKELFFQKIVEYKISYKERQSYQILDSLIFSSDSYTDENGNQIFLEPTEIKLSTLLGHRFDGDVYDFNEKNTSYIALKTSGLIMFTNVTRMMRYLMRQSSLYIDYPQYYTIINGEELVKPLKLCELHRNIAHNSSNPKECTYYNNNWVGNSNITTNHPNSIMAILSYLKYSLLEKPEGYIYKSSKKVKEIEYNPTTIINKTKIGCKTVFSALMEEDDD